jgi:ribose-phosphate pyrophosphokinase
VIVIPGPASVELGKEIAEQLKAKVVLVEFKRFPDGESYIRFDGNVENENVVIVQTTSPPQDEKLIQLLFMADTAKELGAKTITAVVPYLAYARQDKRFRSGESFSVKTIVKLLQACGVKKIFTVNSHSPNVLKTLSLPIVDPPAISLLAQHFKQQGLRDVFSLSLGKKGLDTAIEASKVLEGEYNVISTQRDTVTGIVSIEKKPLPIRNKDVVIFDDIISSGGTMIKAVAWVKEQAAKSVYAACVHPLLIGDAKEKILKNGADGIVGTNTVPSPVSVVSVAPLIAKALKNEMPTSG